MAFGHKRSFERSASLRSAVLFKDRIPHLIWQAGPLLDLISCSKGDLILSTTVLQKKSKILLQKKQCKKWRLHKRLLSLSPTSALFPLGIVYNVAPRGTAGRNFNGYWAFSSVTNSVGVADRSFRRFVDYNGVAKAILALRHQVGFGRISSIPGVN